MLSDLFETRPGRAQEFFKLLRYIGLLVMAPTSALTARGLLAFNDHALEREALAVIAIYTEAAGEALIHFIDTARFYWLWRNRDDLKSYSRRLRGINVPNFIVPIRKTDSGVEVIRRRSYLLIAFLAGILAAAFTVPVIMTDGKSLSTAEIFIQDTSLLFAITIGTGGNVLAGAAFVMERKNWVRANHARIAIWVLSVFWLIFATIHLVCRIWVHRSDDPGLRALANVHFFGIGTDEIVVNSRTELAGKIDAGRIYVGLQEEYGVATVGFTTERMMDPVSLNKIQKIV